MRIAILGARVIDPSSGFDQLADIYSEGGKIVAIGQAPAGFVAEQSIDAQGLIAAPGLVDLNVALREPGYSRKGSIATETLAAAAGGVTSLCCPPFTKPVLDTPAVAELILDRAREAGHTKVFPIGALSKGLEGEQLAELVALRDAGCVAFGNGLDSFRNNRTLRRALEYAATFDLTVIFHSQDFDLAEGGLAHEGATASFLGLPGIPESAETVALARDLLLVEQTGVRAHFSQLTSARGAQLIASAQARGLPVTADVALYQLILTDEALIDFSSLYHVQPPLRTQADRDGLSSLHVNFHPENESAAFGEDWLRREDIQYHWQNRGWPDFEAFLADLEMLWQKGARQFKFVDRTFNLKVDTSLRIMDFFLGKIAENPDDPPFAHFELIYEKASVLNSAPTFHLTHF